MLICVANMEITQRCFSVVFFSHCNAFWLDGVAWFNLKQIAQTSVFVYDIHEKIDFKDWYIVLLGVHTATVLGSDVVHHFVFKGNVFIEQYYIGCKAPKHFIGLNF